MSLYQRVLGNPFVYNHVRPLAVGGIDMSPFYERLGAGSGAVVLDIGCGTGAVLPHLSGFDRYVGFDTDAVAIEFAQSRYGTRPGVSFHCRHMTAADVQEIQPTHVLMAGLLHHLTDDEAVAMFHDVRSAQRLVRVVTQDIIYLRNKWLNNFYARMDRGRYCRMQSAYESLAERGGFQLEESRLVRCHPRTGLTWYLMMALTPRSRDGA